jgi:hypothetical protein
MKRWVGLCLLGIVLGAHPQSEFPGMSNNHQYEDLLDAAFPRPYPPCVTGLGDGALIIRSLPSFDKESQIYLYFCEKNIYIYRFQIASEKSLWSNLQVGEDRFKASIPYVVTHTKVVETICEKPSAGTRSIIKKFFSLQPKMQPSGDMVADGDWFDIWFLTGLGTTYFHVLDEVKDPHPVAQWAHDVTKALDGESWKVTPISREP